MARTFSKRQVKAIQSIAKGVSETKCYVFEVQPGANFLGPTATVGTAPNQVTGIPTGPTGRYAFNLHGWIPRNVTGVSGQALPTSETIIGNEFESVGVAVRSAILTSPNNTRNWRVRLSVVSADWHDVPGTSGMSISGDNYAWMNQETLQLYPTVQGFGPAVRVLKQKYITGTTDGGVMRINKLWCPITGKKTLNLVDLDPLRLTTQGLAGRNYFLIVEWYFSGGAWAPSTSDFIKMHFEVNVYFKDP